MSETLVPLKCHNYSVNALVLENQPPGTFVLRVQAHDADTGVNGEVKYGIMQRDGASPGFTINPDTGISFLLYQVIDYMQLNMSCHAFLVSGPHSLTPSAQHKQNAFLYSLFHH